MTAIPKFLVTLERVIYHYTEVKVEAKDSNNASIKAKSLNSLKWEMDDSDGIYTASVEEISSNN